MAIWQACRDGLELVTRCLRISGQRRTQGSVHNNGIYRRPNDLDWLSFVKGGNQNLSSRFSSENIGLIKKLPQVPLANYAYRNNGDLTFTNVADAWGLAQPGFSNGAAYVDLNNRGELDLVANNIDAPASIYRNRARERNGNAYLTVALRGSGANTAGFGTKVIVRTRERPRFSSSRRPADSCRRSTRGFILASPVDADRFADCNGRIGVFQVLAACQ